MTPTETAITLHTLLSGPDRFHTNKAVRVRAVLCVLKEDYAALRFQSRGTQFSDEVQLTP